MDEEYEFTSNNNQNIYNSSMISIPYESTRFHHTQSHGKQKQRTDVDDGNFWLSMSKNYGKLVVSNSLEELLGFLELGKKFNEVVYASCNDRFVNPFYYKRNIAASDSQEMENIEHQKKKIYKKNLCSIVSFHVQTNSPRIQKLRNILENCYFNGSLCQVSSVEFEQVSKLNLLIQKISKGIEFYIENLLKIQNFRNNKQHDTVACRFCWKVFKSGKHLGGHISKMHAGCSEVYLEKQAVTNSKKIEECRRKYFNLFKGDLQDNPTEKIEMNDKYQGLLVYEIQDILPAIPIQQNCSDSFRCEQNENQSLMNLSKTKKICKSAKKQKNFPQKQYTQSKEHQKQNFSEYKFKPEQQELFFQYLGINAPKNN